MYKIINTLRKIRNQSAHQLFFSLEQPPVKERFNELKRDMLTRKSYQLTKKRYLRDSEMNNLDEYKCILLTLSVVLESILTSIEQTTPIVKYISATKN
jgi:hypothetical protein